MNVFAPTAVLRFQLRQRLKKMRAEDKDIMWEGVHHLCTHAIGVSYCGSALPPLCSFVPVWSHRLRVDAGVDAGAELVTKPTDPI